MGNPPRQHLVEAKIAKRSELQEHHQGGASQSRVRRPDRIDTEVGYVVKSINEDEVEEICEIRGAIEGVGARWAMEKAPQKLIADLKKNISISEERAAGETEGFRRTGRSIS